MNLQLLELIGSGYVIDNYISVFHKEQEEKAYRIYVTDTLRIITENTAKAVHEGSYFKMRFAEVLNPPKQETRTEEEVITSLMDKLRKV